MKAGNEEGELKVNTRRGQGLVEHRVQGTANKQRAGGAQVKSGKNFENISHSKHTNTTVSFINLLYRYTRNYVHYGNCVLLGYYAANSDNFLPTLQDNLPVPSSRSKNPKQFLNPEDRTDTLSRNISNKLPLLAA